MLKIRSWWIGIKMAFVAVMALLLLGSSPSVASLQASTPNASFDTSSLSTRYDYLGHQLMCVCGCNSVLLECNDLNCTYRDQMEKKLKTAIIRGDSDGQILQAFVQKYGSVVLAAPTHKGFNRVAWIMPYLALLLGILGVTVLVWQWKLRRVPRPTLGASRGDAPQLDKYCRRIQEETEL